MTKWLPLKQAAGYLQMGKLAGYKLVHENPGAREPHSGTQGGGDIRQTPTFSTRQRRAGVGRPVDGL